MSLCEEMIAISRFEWTQHYLDEEHNPVARALTFYILSSVILVVFACLITIYFAPGASGSGIAEMIALLNGVNYPGVIGYNVLYVKIIGTTLACSSGLTIGKESPLAHIGSILGVLTCYIPLDFFRSL